MPITFELPTSIEQQLRGQWADSTFRGPAKLMEELLRIDAARYPQSAFTAAAGGREFAPPEHPSDDWVLHLRRTD